MELLHQPEYPSRIDSEASKNPNSTLHTPFLETLSDNILLPCVENVKSGSKIYAAVFYEKGRSNIMRGVWQVIKAVYTLKIDGEEVTFFQINLEKNIRWCGAQIVVDGCLYVLLPRMTNFTNPYDAMEERALILRNHHYGENDKSVPEVEFAGSYEPIGKYHKLDVRGIPKVTGDSSNFKLLWKDEPHWRNVVQDQLSDRTAVDFLMGLLMYPSNRRKMMLEALMEWSHFEYKSISGISTDHQRWLKSGLSLRTSAAITTDNADYGPVAIAFGSLLSSLTERGTDVLEHSDRCSNDFQFFKLGDYYDKVYQRAGTKAPFWGDVGTIRSWLGMTDNALDVLYWRCEKKTSKPALCTRFTIYPKKKYFSNVEHVNSPENLEKMNMDTDSIKLCREILGAVHAHPKKWSAYIASVVKDYLADHYAINTPTYIYFIDHDIYLTSPLLKGECVVHSSLNPQSVRRRLNLLTENLQIMSMLQHELI